MVQQFDPLLKCSISVLKLNIKTRRMENIQCFKLGQGVEGAIPYGFNLVLIQASTEQQKLPIISFKRHKKRQSQTFLINHDV